MPPFATHPLTVYLTISQKHQVVARTSPKGIYQYWTGIGFMQVTEGARLNFELPSNKIIPMSMRYDLYIKYDDTPVGWDRVDVSYSLADMHYIFN